MSKIEWTDETWNPVVGCSVVSPGCTNCYAMRMAARLERMGTKHYTGLTKRVNGKDVWTGKVALAPDHILTKPLHRQKPTVYFPDSMGDLFYENVPDAEIDRAFAVMALCPQHTFMPLTKRSGRMRTYMTNNAVRDSALAAHTPWPLPNVHLGTSVEDRARKTRIDDLRATPAAVRFLSLEPLLEDLGEIDLTGIHGVILGGESGPGARPMHPDWARAIRDQCVAAGVAFFFKQWGEWRPGSDFTNRSATPPICLDRTGRQVTAPARRGDFPEGATSADGWSWMRKIGKKKAGRLLDGRTWDEVPRIKSEDEGRA